MKKGTVLAVVATLMLSGCGASSPWQGAGALYMFRDGKIKCVDVDSVTFSSSRHTRYVVEGKKYSVAIALEYKPNKQCDKK